MSGSAPGSRTWNLTCKRELANSKTIKVWSEQVPQPIAVRYAWEDNPAEANVVNKESLPMLPFRTDDWKGYTDDIK